MFVIPLLRDGSSYVLCRSPESSPQASLLHSNGDRTPDSEDDPTDDPEDFEERKQSTDASDDSDELRHEV